MSRSYRKSPVHGVCADSESWDKKNWHGRFRASERDRIRHLMAGQIDDDEILFDEEEEVYNEYWGNKDGKIHFGRDSEWYHNWRAWRK